MGGGKVYLYRKANIFHLLTEMYNPSAEELEKFGDEVAYFRAVSGAGGWFRPELNLHPETPQIDPRMSLEDLLALIGPDNEVCMCGRECPNH